MKLLIIAGPYEADRIRKVAVSAGFETVAVEPGESLSGWITASRPQLIVMAPQMVHADPALALAKVRSVPRGRVPIFLVGDEADEPRMASLAEGFFVRPVSPEALLEHAKVVLAAERAREATNLGHEFQRGSRTPSLRGTASAVAAAVGSPPVPVRPGATLRPLVTRQPTGTSPVAARTGGDTTLLLAELDAGIDALLDAELSDALAAAPKASPESRGTEFDGEVTAKVKPAALAQTLPEPAAPEPPKSEPPKRTTTKRNHPAPEPLPKPAEPPRSESPQPEPPQPEIPAPEPPRPDVAASARSRILSRYALVEVGDYFQVLGLPRDATAGDVRRAHDRLAGELDPSALDARVAGELGPEIAAIRTVAGEALRILGDDHLRTRYRSRL